MQEKQIGSAGEVLCAILVHISNEQHHGLQYYDVHGKKFLATQFSQVLLEKLYIHFLTDAF